MSYFQETVAEIKTPDPDKKLYLQRTYLEEDLPAYYKDSLYNWVTSIEPKDAFKYIGVGAVIIYLISKFDITINLIFGLIVTVIVIYYMQNKKTVLEEKEQDRIKTELKDLKPQPKLFYKYPELIEFFTSIQDLYDYNPTVYEAVAFNVDNLLQVYEDIKNGVYYCGYNYDIAYQRKYDALNQLQSIIFNLDVNKLLQQKLYRAVFILHRILDVYIADMKKICDTKVKRRGYDIDTKVIANGPRPFNYYPKTKFTFELY